MPSVLITGASRGIGRATALRLAAAGWDVYAGVRNAQDAAALGTEHGRITPVTLDVTDPGTVNALPAALPGRLDAVVNNAGIVIDGPIEAIPLDELRRQFEVNVVGQVAVTQAVLPGIRESRGRIVFISSLSGRVSTPWTGAYNASKFAVEGLADAMRLELRPWGIRVILVEPTSTDTDLWRTALDKLDATEAAMSPEHRRLYATMADGMRRATKVIQRQAVPVEGVVRTIERALTDERPKARYAVGLPAKVQVALSAVTPTRVMDALLGRALGVPKRAG
jgi:NAD(P)-dependent dehydrogenase (short-subunit alcohol dehydrogenase family)